MAKRVSDIIKRADIESWNIGDIITITAGTGSGKSHFIKNDLYEYAKSTNKKILMLVHRSNCYDQFYEEIKANNKQDIIKIETYQKLEYMSLYKKAKLDFSEFDFIVCDEFHYFLNDSKFNEKTDISFNAIVEQANAIKVFMSATGENMKLYINKKRNLITKDYKLEIKYYFIKQAKFFYTEKTMDDLINKFIISGTKAIFFIQSVEKAYELYKKYEKHCLFNCSKFNQKYYKYVNKDKINNMLKFEKFDENILITTTCMDAGVNIKDIDLKSIVTDVCEIEALIQCIGRKRIQSEDDKINLYIKCSENQKLGGIKRELMHSLKRIKYLKTHSVKEYIEKFPRSAGFDKTIFDDTGFNEYNVTKGINTLMEFKYEINIKEIEEILKHKKLGYIKYVSKKLQISEYKIIEIENKKEETTAYLQKIRDQLLDTEQKEELGKIINKKDSSQRPYKSIGKLNQYLLDANIPYKIIPKVIKNKTYWTVISTK